MAARYPAVTVHSKARPKPRCRSGKSHDSFPLGFFLRCCMLHATFSFWFPLGFSSPLGAAGQVPTPQKANPLGPIEHRRTRFMHPCEISSSDKRDCGLVVSLLCSLLPTLNSPSCASCYHPGRDRQREDGPSASERTSHLTPSPDLSHVALGGARGARPKPCRTMQVSETLAATGPAPESSFLFRQEPFCSFCVSFSARWTACTAAQGDSCTTPQMHDDR